MAKKKDSQFAVKFFKGTSQQYNAITPNFYTFYFLTDVEKLYLGRFELTNVYVMDAINTINQDLQGKANIQRKTTAQWNQDRFLMSQAGTIYIYIDRYQKEDEDTGEIINVPGIKIGDGTTYVIDLPFVSGNDDTFLEHINNHNIHVTLEQKEFWNNKVRIQDSEILDEQNLIFTKF